MTVQFAFAPQAPASLPIAGITERFPVHRVYCVAKNYAAHAREMGADPERQPPAFFLKPADAVVAASGAIPYPPATRELHHEIELVVALSGGGRGIALEEAHSLIFGYAVGLDLTRRDLQNQARSQGGPWDAGKSFEAAAPVTAIQPLAATGIVASGRVWLTVNGEPRQEGDVGDMIWTVSEIIVRLSQLFELRPGDLIFTGTPEGVGPLLPGDQVRGGVAGVAELELVIAG